MTNRLDRLEKRGLTKRQTDPGDRRRLKIVLLEEGFRLANELVVSHLETEEQVLSALSVEERQEFKTLLNRIG